MIPKRSLPALSALLLITFSGCAVTPIQTSGASDPIVVNAERTIQAAQDTIDTFLKFERANRASLPAEVHKYAEFLRSPDPVTRKARAQQWIISAEKLTEAYKHNRSADNKATMQTGLSVLLSAMTQANVYLTRPASP